VTPADVLLDLRAFRDELSVLRRSIDDERRPVFNAAWWRLGDAIEALDRAIKDLERGAEGPDHAA
jgi:hypothetical protein